MHTLLLDYIEKKSLVLGKLEKVLCIQYTANLFSMAIMLSELRCVEC